MPTKSPFFPLLAIFLFSRFCLASISFFNSNDTLVHLPTSSYFQYRQPFFEAAGKVVELVLFKKDKSSECSVLTDNLPINDSSLNDTIIFLDYDKNNCSLKCFSEAFLLAFRFRAILLNRGFPSPNTFLVFRKRRLEEGDAGNPFFEYKCRDTTLSNSGPPDSLNFQLLDLRESELKSTLDALRNNQQLVLYVKQEDGRWNQAFFSTAYTTTCYILQGILGLMIIWSFYQYYVSYLDGALTMDIKHFVFILALANCFITLYKWIFLWICTRSFSIFNHIQELLFIPSFYSLLYLWSLLFIRLTRSRTGYVFSVVVLSSGIALVSIICFRIADNLGFVAEQKLKDFIVRYLGVGVQAFTAIIFLFFVLFFFRRAEISSLAAEDTAEKLRFLQWLAVIGFASFFIFALFDSPLWIYLRNFAHLYAIQSACYYILYEIRLSVLLLIIVVGRRSASQRRPSWIERRIESVRETITAIKP